MVCRPRVRRARVFTREFSRFASARRVDLGGMETPLSTTHPVDAERTELLVRLLTKHQDDLFRFIFALLPHEEDARDVLQETSVAVCRKFFDYDVEQPFLPWAFGFAYLETLKHRERDQ